MAKTKQRSSSASHRREEVKKQRQQRMAPRPGNQSHSNQRRRSKTNQTPWGLIVGVLLIIAAVIVIFLFLSKQSTGTGSTNTQRTPTSSSVLNALTHVSPAVSTAVGTGGQQKLLVSLKGGGSTPSPLLGPNGKPEFLYMGAEYCPYCAAERWAVVVALSRFGTFSKINQTTSSATDVYPSTPTFSFYQSAYTSQYIDFASVEETTNQPDASGGYTTLQTPTTDQQNIFNKYDAPPYLSSASSIPFIDIGNQYAMQGANYSPQVLSGLSWQTIANDLSNPNSDVTKGIVGSANYLTAAICLATNQQPAAACNAAPIPQIEQSLNKTAFNAGGLQAGIVPGQFEMLAWRQD